MGSQLFKFIACSLWGGIGEGFLAVGLEIQDVVGVYSWEGLHRFGKAYNGRK